MKIKREWEWERDFNTHTHNTHTHTYKRWHTRSPSRFGKSAFLLFYKFNNTQERERDDLSQTLSTIKIFLTLTWSTKRARRTNERTRSLSLYFSLFLPKTIPSASSSSSSPQPVPRLTPSLLVPIPSSPRPTPVSVATADRWALSSTTPWRRWRDRFSVGGSGRKWSWWRRSRKTFSRKMLVSLCDFVMFCGYGKKVEVRKFTKR